MNGRLQTFLHFAECGEQLSGFVTGRAADAVGQITLGNLYDAEENNLRTLFDFGDNSFKFRNFSGKDQFVASYPFPNYQYDLFQRAIMGLSQHNAFEGKHSSVGERSMLGVFQEVAKKLADTPVGGWRPLT